MSNIAVFPGSFDPITLGHVDVIKRATPLFDKVIIAIGVNSEKSYQFPVEKRMEWINDIFSSEEKISCEQYEGLTVDFCVKTGANYIVRGVRSGPDFDFEKSVAQLNQKMNKNLDTLLLVSKPELSHISSSIVREIIRNGGDISSFVPSQVKV
ncbi:MAG: pantetheine-phosphate adenylyltransferase [Bacteroidetes bacterium]|nr:pantetheine-phosphate adenylyltransferase [Bacteroidota bacterium]